MDNKKFVLENGFLDLEFNNYISNFRKNYDNEYRVIYDFNNFTFDVLDKLVAKGNTKQNMYIMGNLVEIHKFYQSTILLFERGLPDCANSLVRTMIDILIKTTEAIRNINFVDQIILTEDYENRKTLKNINDNKLYDIVPKDMIERYIRQNTNDIGDRKKPEIDTKKLAKKNNLLELYILFRIQSSYTHQSTSCLNDVITKDKKGYYINENINVNNFKFNICMPLTILTKLLEIILIEYIGNKELKDKYNKLMCEFENNFKDLL